MPPEDRSAIEASGHSPIATLHALEHRVEAAVDEVLREAERSLARRFGAGCVQGLRIALRALWIALVVAYFAFGALWLATRYWLMPRIDEHRPWIEREASRLLDAQVRIARIESGWRGFNPHLRLTDVQVADRNGQTALTLPQLEATLSWASVPALQPRFRDLWILTPELDVHRRADGRFLVAGFVIDPKAAGDTRIAEWVLSQSHIGIRNARVRYRDAGIDDGGFEFDDVDFDFRHGLVNNRFAFRARPPAALGGPIDVRGEYRRPWFERATDVLQWSGRVFAQMDYADVARVAQLTHALPVSMSIARAQGALRTWLDFDQGRIERLLADLALVDVEARLGEQLAPLRVEHLQGRIEQREWGTIRNGGQEFSARQLTLVGTGFALPPTDARVRVTRAAGDKPERGLVEASGLSLTAATALAAHLPLPAAWRESAARYGVRGDLANLRYTWEGDAEAPSQYTLHTRLDRVSMRGTGADPAFAPDGTSRAGRPGFENLSGTLELDHHGGTAQIRAQQAVLDFPGVFEQPLPFERLSADARWSMRDPFEIRIDSLAASSRDVELNGQAAYRSGGKGAGLIDANGRIVRVEANQLHKFIPLTVAAGTRNWLRRALLSGTVRDGSYRVKGDLADFPFAQPASGEFQIAARIVGAALDYLPARADEPGAVASYAWPTITSIDGDFLYERRKIEFTARRARIFGLQLDPVRAAIPDLSDPESRLLIDGKANGPAADLIRYVNASPIGSWLGDSLAHTSATGDGALDLALDIALNHERATRVRGSVTLAGNDLKLRDDLPPFSRIIGRLEFTEKSMKIPGLTGHFIGGPFHADVNTRADGAIEIVGSGSATPQAARRLVDTPLAQRLLERAQGSARYAANVIVRNRRTEMRVESDLVGFGLDVPEPLGKTAPEAAPLRIEIAPRDSGSTSAEADTIRAGIGSRLALRIDRIREAGGPSHVERGAVVLGEGSGDVPAVPDHGLRVTLTTRRLDVDRWRALLDGQLAGGGVSPDSVAAQAQELVIGGKSIANVVLGATRGSDGAWLANIHSDHVNGAITWHPPDAGTQGGVSARLARLAVPEQERTQLTELLDAPPTELPALDIVADEFELAGRKLGRLELLAQNAGTGPNAVWQLQKLDLDNPDAHMSAGGQWQRAADGGERRMAMNLTLDFSDAGNLLARFGMPDALHGGEGRLEGEIGWRGSPLSIDYPSLAGKLKLATAKGQFLKGSAGAGRLLGVLSLQSLPRRISLDFRDVFSEGFAFDSVVASADVNAGVLSTRNFKMRGASATVLIDGTADLRQETQDLHVLVLPEVNAGSASLMYALLANPAVGLGTFLAQWLLRDPLSKAFSYEYDISGPWNDPQVKRRDHSSKDIAGALPN